jgi:hypothetical protein
MARSKVMKNPWRTALSHVVAGTWLGLPVQVAAQAADQGVQGGQVRWIRKKYRRLRPRRKARVVWERLITQHPRYFAHWAWVRNPLLMARVVRAE